MLQTVRDVCKFKQAAIDFALTSQIEDLADLIGHSENDARAFFDKTYVTEGMATLRRRQDGLGIGKREIVDRDHQLSSLDLAQWLRRAGESRNALPLAAS